jgi:hypothetical protein
MNFLGGINYSTPSVRYDFLAIAYSQDFTLGAKDKNVETVIDFGNMKAYGNRGGGYCPIYFHILHAISTTPLEVITLSTIAGSN